jgi:anthranilate phosphoribosyltransferase
VLEGEPGPRRDVILLNAGAAILVAGRADDLAEGVERARQSIDSGAALSVLRAFQTFSQEASDE